MPSAALMPLMSSGEVSMRVRTTFSPRLAQASASTELKTTRPVAAPGPALRPLASRRPALTAACFSAGSKMGRRSWLSWSGSMRDRASFSLMSFSPTMSTAMRMAAKAVRLPTRHWSM
jgi:hypothetical protein